MKTIKKKLPIKNSTVNTGESIAFLLVINRNYNKMTTLTIAIKTSTYLTISLRRNAPDFQQGRGIKGHSGRCAVLLDRTLQQWKDINFAISSFTLAHFQLRYREDWGGKLKKAILNFIWKTKQMGTVRPKLKRASNEEEQGKVHKAQYWRRSKNR